MENKESCWIWNGSKTKQGYGNLQINGKTIYAHRLMAQLTKEDFDEKKVVRHKCDNPACINPSHLCLGTQKDNMQDWKNKKKKKAQYVSPTLFSENPAWREEGKYY